MRAAFFFNIIFLTTILYGEPKTVYETYTVFTTPTITSVEVPTNATYTNGAKLNFDINFSEPVNVSGSPFLSLTIGTSTVSAMFDGSDGTSQLSFEYTVQTGDLDQDGIEIGLLDLNGGTIQDFTGDDADLTLNNVGDLTGVGVDAVIPEITSIQVPSDDTYGQGEELDFLVNFDDLVFIIGTSPQLVLNIGGTIVNASYTGGLFATSLPFTYTVQSGEEDTDGIEIVSLTGGIITDQALNSADRTLNNVGNLSNVLVDAVGPIITSVNGPADGTYDINDDLNFSVNFDETVTVTGSPQLSIQIGSSTVTAGITGGSGTSTLSFAYTVQAGDEDTDGITINSLSLNGGTIEDALTNSATTTLNNIDDLSGVLVDGISPVVMSVDVPADGNYRIGLNLIFTVNFSEQVNVSGSPELSFVIGSTTVEATLTGGSGTSALTFSYLVQTGDEDLDGITVALLDLNGGGIEDLPGNDADLTLNNIADASNVLVDGIVATIVSVSVPADDIYGAEDDLSFDVEFSEIVDVTGTPQLSITIGSSVVEADYDAGTGSTVLTFVYEVQVGDNDTDGIVVNSLGLNGGSIADEAGNNANLSLNNIADASNVLVDGVVPIVTSVGVPDGGTYGEGQGLEFQISFNEPINVAGTPELSVSIDANVIAALFTGGSGTNTLSFAYTIQTGDQDLDGIAIGTLSLSGGIIEDIAGTDADLTLNNVENSDDVLVDAIAPIVVSVSVPSNDIYSIDEVLSFEISFDQVVDVIGTPQLSLTIGSSSVEADYQSGSGSQDLTFTYTVQPGDEDTDGITVSSLGLNGGSIRDDLGNNTDLTLNGVADASGVLVDGVAPTITSVDVPTDDTYIIGENLNFTVNFDDVVDIVGSPELSILIGTTTVVAANTGGSGTTSLTFSYLIKDGDEDLDGITVSTLNLNSGTIQDAVGNDADLMLNNIDPTINVLVDAIKPQITIGTASDDPTNDDPILIEVNFSESVTDFMETDLLISGGSSSNFSGTGDAYTFDLTPDADGTITIDIAADIAFDDAGNGNRASTQFQIESDMTEPSGYSVAMGLGGESVINTVNQSSITFTITGGEVGATLTYEFEDIDGLTISGTETVTATNQTFDNVGAGYDLTTLANGNITLTISLTDPAGNAGSDENTIELKDVSPPSGYVIVWNDNLISAAEAPVTTFTLNDGEENSTLEYTVTSSGGSSIGPFTVTMDATNAQIVTVDVSTLEDGVLTVEGRLIDTENNIGTNVSDDADLDQTPPNFISVSDNGDGNYRAGESIILIADLDETGLTVTGDLSVFDSDFGNSVALTDQTDGTYTLTSDILDLTDGMNEGNISVTISATDAAGNNASDNTLTLLLDKTSPNSYTVVLDELLYRLNNHENASFTFSSAEIGSTYQYEISSSGGAIVIAGSGEVTSTSQQVTGIDISNLEDGDLLLSVTLTDISGNTGLATTYTDSEKVTAPPVVTPAQVFAVDENSSNGTTVGTVVGTDPANAPLTDWTITDGDSEGVFSIDPNSGEITIADNSTLDFETTVSYNLTITVKNDTIGSDPETVIINVNDVNDNTPQITASQSFSVNENSDNGFEIGAVVATDVDAGTTFSNWTIVSGNESGILTIDVNTGTLSVADNSLLDFESLESIALTLTVSDGSNTSPQEIVTISIINQNDNAPIITSGQTLIVPTPLSAGTSLGSIEATDPDGVTVFSNWTIVSGNEANLFALDATTGELTLNTTSGVDELSYSLVITVSDGENTSLPESITILIGDTISPDVVLSSPVSEATNVSTQTFTATFDEVVIGFEESDISVSNGTASNLTSTDQIIFTFDVNAVNEGTVDVLIPAGVLTDNFSNTNNASNTISFVYDITPPLATISSNNGELTNQSTSELSILFTEIVVGLALNDMTSLNASLDNLEFSNGTYSFTSFSNEGSVEITLAAGAVSDLAGNPNPESSISWTIDQTPPSSYEINVLDEVINTLNQDNLRLEILGGDSGSSYSYAISGVDPIIGSGTIGDSGSQIVSGIDVTNLADGLLSISLTLTDVAGNLGDPVFGEVIKNTSDEIPQGFNPDRERWIIPGIENFPDNKVVIFNRYGNRLWEIEGYDNQDKSWNGSSNVSGVIGSGGAPDGTYFYVLEFLDGSLPSKSGFVIIKR